MQRTVTEQAMELGLERPEPQILQLIRADARIRSVVIIRTATAIGAKLPANDCNIKFKRPSNADEETFEVTDMLEDITYLVSRAGPLSLLVFKLENQQIEVGVQPGSDLIEIAHDFATHLETIRSNI